jgi:hypothetical protein
MADAPNPATDLEDLLAEALAKFDEGGESALAAFVQAHPAHATALQRGIQRCRQMGLLGSDAAAATAAHPERLGEFRLLRRIGGGGMGVVYEAIQEPLGRRVALKIIRPELLFFEGARERCRTTRSAKPRIGSGSCPTRCACGCAARTIERRAARGGRDRSSIHPARRRSACRSGTSSSAADPSATG